VLLHLSALLVAFVSADDHLGSVQVHTVPLHFFFPVDEADVAVAVVDVEGHQDSATIFVEVGSDSFVLVVAAQIEEVYADFVPKNIQLLDTIIYTDGRNVSLDEAPFAVPLDKTALARLLVAHADNLEHEVGRLGYLILSWVKREGATSWLAGVLAETGTFSPG